MNGGGGGNRTRVRKKKLTGYYVRSPRIWFRPRKLPADRINRRLVP